MSAQALRRLFTVDEFHQMADAAIFGEDDRVELLSGEIVERTPSGSRHAACVSRLNRWLGHDLARWPVTVAQSRAFVEDAKCTGGT